MKVVEKMNNMNCSGNWDMSHPMNSFGAWQEITTLKELPVLRKRILEAWRRSEHEALSEMLQLASLSKEMTDRSHNLAAHLVNRMRNRDIQNDRSALVQGLLQEFSLSSDEGIALMCLAEAFLRIPDAPTRDALIEDKLCAGNWALHVGQSESIFVNAAAWGLMLSAKLLNSKEKNGLGASLSRALAKGGEPLIRKAMGLAMRLMGQQFVAGETINEGIKNAKKFESIGFRYSYDMLGEAAVTMSDAKRYIADYESAIHAIGKSAKGIGVYKGPGVSIKLSALHPRYCRAQVDRVENELYPALLHLAKLACQYDIGLNIDAEETDRVDLSLDLLERLCFEQELKGWNGIGFVVQAYQKRSPFVIDYLIDLAKRSQHRLMVRLVKGAYWDSEIKRAQMDGFEDYPVYTRKAFTDISYVVCARKLLEVPDVIYPQFATHNAYTLSVIMELANPDAYYDGQYEFQCLHGMGEPLYEQIVGSSAVNFARPCRIYAPVGTHETLLAYLVRRLLENGANTSFVNRVADPSVSINDLIKDPVEQVREWMGQEGMLGKSHPHIPLPLDLYGPMRKNSSGIDLANENILKKINDSFRARSQEKTSCSSPFEQKPKHVVSEQIKVINPANNRDKLGYVRVASFEEIKSSINAVSQFAPTWAETEPGIRASALIRSAEMMEGMRDQLIFLIVREAGKSIANAISEVREAVDFLRYYASQVNFTFETSTHQPLGPVVCISPWNFPLAIFTGQVAAALAAGNTVLAKPSEQTNFIALEAVKILWKCGVPQEALQVIIGEGRAVGPILIEDSRVQGVMFTGSTEVAKILQSSLSKRLNQWGKPVPLIAETGGQNAMIVESSALPEQVVMDVVASAFDAAGQRCSALRVLCLQEEVAKKITEMLIGAMRELRLGDPMQLCNDIGPVIDKDACDTINAHIEKFRQGGFVIHQAAYGGESEIQALIKQGNFVLPTLIEIDSVSDLSGEVFGPVLHIVKFKRENLKDLMEGIKSSGYGLTMGLHTRIDQTQSVVKSLSNVGNLYVNRNMIGAVVGVQPFGGEGLSGTGPKAGGPLYLNRLLNKQPNLAISNLFGAITQADLPSPEIGKIKQQLDELKSWCAKEGISIPAPNQSMLTGFKYLMPGPTGELNCYELKPRATVLCLAKTKWDLLLQLTTVVGLGSRAVWDSGNKIAVSVFETLPILLRKQITLSANWELECFDVVIQHGSERDHLFVQEKLAKREGAILSLVAMCEGDPSIPIERLMTERVISINTAAAGGNATLMAMG